MRVHPSRPTFVSRSGARVLRIQLARKNLYIPTCTIIIYTCICIGLKHYMDPQLAICYYYTQVACVRL